MISHPASFSFTASVGGHSFGALKNAASRENFVKNLPKFRVYSLTCGILLHASKQSVSYAVRATNFNSLRLIVKYHPLEIVVCGLIEPILREISAVIVSGIGGSSAISELLRSVATLVLAMCREIHIQYILPVIITLIEEHFPSSGEGRRQCAMTLIGVCVRSFGDSICLWASHFWEILTTGVHDESPHVREAACFSIGFWISHPQLRLEITGSCTSLLPTIMKLCSNTVTNVAACTVLLPLLKGSVCRGEAHNIMLLSFQLLEELPPSFKYFSPSIMGYIAGSLGGNFTPYLGASMRHLEDFASFEQIPSIYIAILCATACFANAVGKEAFLPYLENTVKNALRALIVCPGVYTQNCLTFLGIMAQLSKETFSYYLPAIATTFMIVAPSFTEKDELILAETICHIVDTPRGSIHPDLFSCVQLYIDMIKILLSRDNIGIRSGAIQALFRLISMLHHIEINPADGPKRESFVVQAKTLLLNANITGIRYFSLMTTYDLMGIYCISDVSPLELMSNFHDHVLALDMILGGPEIPENFFPVTTMIFTKPAPSGIYILDISSFIATIIPRCSSPYSPLVQSHAFATLTHILSTINDISWVSVEAWVLRLLPILYRGMSQGNPEVRPTATRALGRLVYTTQLDISRLYPPLLRRLHDVLAIPCIAKISKNMVNAAASTMSLIALKAPGMRDSSRVYKALVRVLELPLEIGDALLTFRALHAIVVAQPTLATTTSLFVSMLQFCGQITYGSGDPPHTDSIKKAMVQIMLDVILANAPSAQVKAVDPRLFIQELHCLLTGDSEISRETVSMALATCIRVTDPIARERPTEHPCLPHIDRIPPEVIAQIMVFCLPRGRDWDLAGAENLPLILGQINGTWRQVALHTPGIWANLDIEIGLGPQEGRASAITPIVSVWLARSGGLPLNIAVKCFRGSSLGLHRYIDRLAQSILPFSRFWKNIHLQLPFSTSKQFYQAHQKYCRMPRLRSLTIVGCGFALLPHDPSFSLEFAPSLRVLDLHDAGLGFNALRVTWGQLTELRLRIVDWSTQQCVDMLNSCHQVKSLRLIHQTVGWSQDQYVGPIISLPHLEMLHVSHGFIPLILSMVMPRLRELYMEHWGFSLRLVWTSGNLNKFISTLARFKGVPTPPAHTIRDLMGYNNEERKFFFTVIDPDHSALHNFVNVAPDLAIFAQFLGTMEFNCSAYTDRALADFINYILWLTHFSPTYNIVIVARREVGEELERELGIICDKHKEVKFTLEGQGLTVHISRPQGTDLRE